MAVAIIVPAGVSGGPYQIVGLTSAGGGGTVLFDAKSGLLHGNAGVSTSIFGSYITVGSGTNRALLAFLFFAGNNAGTASSPTLTWNGTSMGSPLGGPYANGTVGDIYIFGTVAPASGTNSFVASWTGSAQAALAAISVTGADQTGGATTFHNITSNTGTGTLPSVTSTIPTGEVAAAAFISTANFTTAGNTDIGSNNTMNSWAVAADYTTTTGSQTLSYSPNGNFAAVSVCIKAA